VALSFPNVSRNYDTSKQLVCFWGYDSAFEISFFIGREALQSIAGRPCNSEAESLTAFDANRSRIHKVALKTYSRRRGNFHSLLPGDF